MNVIKEREIKKKPMMKMGRPTEMMEMMTQKISPMTWTKIIS